MRKNKPVPGKDGNKYIPFDQRTGESSVVFFTRDLSEEGLKKIYDKISPKVDLQIKAEREAAKKVEEESVKAAEQLKTEVDKGVETIVEERPQFFTKKDKHFKKNRFEQRQKVTQEVVEEVKVEEPKAE